MKRAKRSANRPNVSSSNWGRGISRRFWRGTSSRSVRRSARASRVCSDRDRRVSRLDTEPPGSRVRAIAPVLRQQVVEQVVDRDRAEQAALVVEDRCGDEVVRREVQRDLFERGGRLERLEATVRQGTGQGGRRVPGAAPGGGPPPRAARG